MTAEGRHADESSACRVCDESSEEPDFLTDDENALLLHLRDRADRPFLEGYLLHVLRADGVREALEAIHTRRRARELAQAAMRLEQARQELLQGHPESTDGTTAD